MWLLTGDSIAVGLSQHLHPAALIATVGQGSSKGAAAMRSDKHGRVVVSLGVNDDPRQREQFARRVRLVLQGRQCVVWLTMPSHVGFNDELRRIKDKRLRLVSGRVSTVDGIHPTQTGYRTLAVRVRRALSTC
jgi:hypothetical protein